MPRGGRGETMTPRLGPPYEVYYVTSFLETKFIGSITPLGQRPGEFMDLAQWNVRSG